MENGNLRKNRIYVKMGMNKRSSKWVLEHGLTRFGGDSTKGLMSMLSGRLALLDLRVR